MTRSVRVAIRAKNTGSQPTIPSQGKTVHALGVLRPAQGDSNSAIALFRKALAMFSNTVDHDTFMTADTSYCLAERLLATQPGAEQEVMYVNCSPTLQPDLLTLECQVAAGEEFGNLW